MILLMERARRVSDVWGSGHFGASRGADRTHKGIDFLYDVGEVVYSPTAGAVTKIGYCYGDDLSFRYIEITDADEFRHRVLYAYPLGGIEVGAVVTLNQKIGVSQSLGGRYQFISEHVHYEIISEAGDYIDPDKFHA